MLAGIALVVLVGALPIIWRSLDGDVSVLLALGALCVVSAGQFLVRGTLIGTDRLVRHAAVMVLDAVLRLGFAVGVFVVGGADAAAFCWALVAAIALAHLPQLPGAWRRAVAWERPSSPGAPADRPSVRGLTRAAMPLLVGSVCAQLLLNGLPVLVVAEAGEANEAAAGVFVAAFTLAKAPLSMVVPLQSAVVPTLTRLIAAGRRREVVRPAREGRRGLLGARRRDRRARWPGWSVPGWSRSSSAPTTRSAAWTSRSSCAGCSPTSGSSSSPRSTSPAAATATSR